LYGCETGSIILRREHRLRVFEKRVLRKNLYLRERRWQEAVEDCLMISQFLLFTSTR